MRTVSIKIREDLLTRLDIVAARKGVPRSVVIREAIVDFLKKEGMI